MEHCFFANISKPISPTSDSFLLIMSHLVWTLHPRIRTAAYYQLKLSSRIENIIMNYIGPKIGLTTFKTYSLVWWWGLDLISAPRCHVHFDGVSGDFQAFSPVCVNVCVCTWLLWFWFSVDIVLIDVWYHLLFRIEIELFLLYEMRLTWFSISVAMWWWVKTKSVRQRKKVKKVHRSKS